MSSDSAPTIAIRPNEHHERSGLGITWKIFLSTAGVVFLAIAGAIGWSSLRANRLIDQAARDAFRSTEFVFSNVEKARYDKLKRLNTLVAEDPVFKAVILETDEATQQDDLHRRRELLGADLVLATDSEGHLLARSDGRGERGADLSGWPLVDKALAGESTGGILTEQGALVHAVASPIGTAGQDLAGVLLSGYALDEALAGEMKRTTNTEVAFILMRDGSPQVTASTLSRPDEMAEIGKLAAVGATADPRRLSIGGNEYLGLVTPLVTPSGEPAGGLVVLRSIAAEQATFRRLRDSLLLIGLLAVLFAFVVSYLLARRITGPLLKLVRVAEAVRAGQYAMDLPAGSGDEVGALAAAIRAMVRELRDKAELERFVAALGASPDRTAAGDAPTLARSAASGAPTAGTAPAGSGAAAEPRVGETFAGRYEMLEVIGQGGMGKVYKARDVELDEVVALKTIRKELLGASSEALERFKQEIKLARKATHKNIMRTYDFGDAGGVQYLTMEYVKGYTLRDLIRRQKQLPLDIALKIARKTCEGLFAAHDAGIVHRDVKSHNILIQPNGEVKIMDFGIARPQQSSGLTTVGTIIGTPEYMSPEQALGKPADFRSDVYSLGIVYYELFTGQLPFSGETPLEVAMMHVRDVPRRPAEVKPGLPPELDVLIQQMTEKDPAKRFQSFAEVYAALVRVRTPAPARAA